MAINIIVIFIVVLFPDCSPLAQTPTQCPLLVRVCALDTGSPKYFDKRSQICFNYEALLRKSFEAICGVRKMCKCKRVFLTKKID